MHLIDGLRGAQRIVPTTLLHPFVIAPLVVEIPDHRSGARGLFVQQSDRVGFVDVVSTLPRFDVVLIERAASRTRDESLPDTGRSAWFEAVGPGIPLIETA